MPAAARHKPIINTQTNRTSGNRKPKLARTIAAMIMAIPRKAGSIKFEKLFRPADQSENIKRVQTRNGKINANNSHGFQ